MQKPVERQHGPYTIKAGLLAGRAVARAFVTGGKPGVVAEAQGDSVEAAVAALTDELDTRAAGEAAHRRIDAITGYAVPTEAEFARALAVVKPHDAHWRLLRAHALAGDKGLPLKALTFDAGYHDDGATLHQMGIVADQIAGALGLPLPAAPPRKDADPALAILATVAGGATWVMHPELRAAVLAHTP